MDMNLALAKMRVAEAEIVEIRANPAPENNRRKAEHFMKRSNHFVDLYKKCTERAERQDARDAKRVLALQNEITELQQHTGGAHEAPLAIG